MVSDMSSLLAPSCTSLDCLVNDAAHPIRYGTQRGSDAGVTRHDPLYHVVFGSRAGNGRRAECVSSIDQSVDIVFPCRFRHLLRANNSMRLRRSRECYETRTPFAIFADPPTGRASTALCSSMERDSKTGEIARPSTMSE